VGGDAGVGMRGGPTMGGARRQIAEIRALIKSLGGQHTVILSTHILPEVSMVCDSIIIIHRGRIGAQGTQSELVQQVFPAARVEVEIAGPADAIGQALKSIPGVTAVEAVTASDGPARVVLEAPRGRDVRGEIPKLVTARGWGL